ncbi:MAG: small ribosomal subunit biogenesis GTPase RsgA [Leptolyngbyaceae cyanobacterium bins.59]|nr:small ribosomal subunit biogenesis GTPase RsgA [Leptolyngbyaceae cyanobacterium bins.59]
MAGFPDSEAQRRDSTTPKSSLPNQEEPSAPLTGTVLAVQANYYRVQLDVPVVGTPPQPHPLASEETLLCTRRARLKKIGQQVMVGDRVRVEEPDWAGKRGAISEVLPRESELSRPPIANVNQILLIFALAEPDLEPYQLSRFLVKAESTGIAFHLCLSKQDLVSAEEQTEWRDRLRQWGYEPLFMSIHSSQGFDDLRSLLNDRMTVISGPSGVGKSSLINALIPALDLRVGAVSGKLGRGRHTTRHVELFELPTGGLLADTPGFNQPTLTCTPEELASYFPETRHRLETEVCQFSDCLHIDEPNCVVRGDWERYEHYLEFLQEAIDRQMALHEQATPDDSIKVKANRQGQQRYEPRLEAKKYRRVSRKTQQQQLRQLYQDGE